jgi:hypothetical protein
MRPIHVDHGGDRRLRFVFNHAVVSFGLAADATCEDIAQTLAGLSIGRYGKPIAIDVVLGSGVEGNPSADNGCAV